MTKMINEKEFWLRLGPVSLERIIVSLISRDVAADSSCLLWPLVVVVYELMAGIRPDL